MKKIALGITVLLAFAALQTAAFAAPTSKSFSAHLSGDEEVPPRETQAQGHAKFKVTDDDTIEFKLSVANIENVAAAHIHCGEAGVNAPVGVTLFVAAPGGGPIQGVIAEGVITVPDAGNACGWTTVQDVIDAMLDGAAYVNVHTNDGVAPPNEAPGDFPGGEIRGQIAEHGPS
jgi:hypothetical protein